MNVKIFIVQLKNPKQTKQVLLKKPTVQNNPWKHPVKFFEVSSRFPTRNVDTKFPHKLLKNPVGLVYFT